MTELRLIRRNIKKVVFGIDTIETDVQQELDGWDEIDLEDSIRKVESIEGELKIAYGKGKAIYEDEDWDELLHDQQIQIKRLDSLRRIMQRKLKNLQGSVKQEFGQSATQSHEVRLPQLELPTFSGQIEDWISFHDLFTAAVHNNSKLTNAQKLQYLKTSTKGEAARIIKNLSITDANYEVAQGLLKERFSRKRELLFCHINKLMTQPKVVSETSSELLRLVDSTTESLNVWKPSINKYQASPTC